MVLVLLLTLIPAQAAEETGTGTDEGEKTYTVTLNGNGGSLKGEDLVTVTYSEENPLNLWDYPFTQSGYLLAGWSTDESGGWFADRNGTVNSDIGVEMLYAVWLKLPESGNYAIFNTAGAGTIADAVSNANDLYCVELTENFKMPTLQRSDMATAEEISFWSSNSNSSMIYYEGEEFMPNNGMQFNFCRFSGSSDCHQLIFDGNGGTFYPIGSAFTITADMPAVQILYAQWEPGYHLEDNVSLVIGGEDKSDLLDSTTECSGTGWTYQSVDGVSVLHLTKDYNGGSIICKRENVNIVFDDAVSTKRIKVSGALTLTANGDYAKVYESDDTAIRAESVTLAAAAGNYKIVSEKNTAIQAKSLYLNSDDARIEGSPAVPDGTEITCGEKARLQTNRNSDGTISALYTYPKSVTLYGNGGKYGEADVVTVDYPDKGSLNLGQYAETVTLAWANADWSKAAKVKAFFLDADRKPVAEAVTALINGKSQKN